MSHETSNGKPNLKALLVDDEPPANIALSQLLQMHCPAVQIVEICTNSEAAAAAIIRHQPDVVFLDIAMPQESGIEFLKRLGNFDFEVVFVSAYNQYAMDAFALSAVDYVLKPVTASSVVTAVEKVARRRQQKRELERYRLLFDLMQGNAGRMMLPGRNGLHEIVRIPDICFCKADGHSTQFFLADGRRLVTGSNLGEYRSALLPYNFMQTHRSYIANMMMVASYHSGDEVLLMKGGGRVDLGREFRLGVLGWLRGSSN